MTSRPSNKRNSAGFTLIEAMITVAVIAILAAIALPNYFDYITRSRIVEAKTNLADMRTRLEQYFLDNRAYPTGCVDSASGPAPAGKIYYPANQKYFQLVCSNLAATTYLVTANGQGGMSGFIYKVDQANNRTTDGTGAWGKTSGTCWISKKSGEC